MLYTCAMLRNITESEEREKCTMANCRKQLPLKLWHRFVKLVRQEGYF